MRFFVRRAASGMLLLLTVSALSFFLLQLAPGNYFDELRTNAQLSRQTVESLRIQTGESAPLALRYLRWLASVGQGDWGYSFAYNAPAFVVLRPRVWNTLTLTIAGMGLSWVLSLFLGISAAAVQSRVYDRILQVVIAFLLAIPDVLVALLFLLIAVRTASLQAGGLSSNEASAGPLPRALSLIRHLFLPVVCLALSSLPVLLAHVRSALTETVKEPFVRAARSFGIPNLRLLIRHVLPVSANSLISLAGLSVGGLLSSSLVVEVVFGWPGIGKLLLEAVLQRDLYLIVDTTVFASLFLLVGNLCSDMLLYFWDPRIGSR